MVTTKDQVTFCEGGFAERDGVVKVHRAHYLTREYLGPVDAHISAGTGLFAGDYLDAPKMPRQTTGVATVRSEDGSRWEQVPDYRGQMAYEKATGSPQEVTMPGPIQENLTLLAPTSEFDVWDEQQGCWVFDEAAASDPDTFPARKAQEIIRIEALIAPLSRAKQLGIATESELAELAALERYSVELMRSTGPTLPVFNAVPTSLDVV
ncbi:tail fiber assembly protein [Aeromonas veronii]|uniref:tail fiber assembly protein n=1 Tax=Aeromonas veronii TaxID=654 RepID=UPI00366E01D2